MLSFTARTNLLFRQQSKLGRIMQLCNGGHKIFMKCREKETKLRIMKTIFWCGLKETWQILKIKLVRNTKILDYSGIFMKRTPLVQKKKCPLYRDVCFIEIFSKEVWPQSKAIRSSSYCSSYGGVWFIVCPLPGDSTVFLMLL